MELTICSRESARVDEGNSTPHVLFSTLYNELYGLARRELSSVQSHASLDATTLLHEVYLDMAQQETPFFDQAHFLGYATRVMRGLIIDNLRRHRARKRGGEYRLVSIEDREIQAPRNPKEFSLVRDALDQLALVEPELAKIVDLKFFFGFCFAEIGALLQLSERTVQRKWEKARIYLRSSMYPYSPR